MLVLLEAHQRLSTSFQNFKSFRAKKASASAHEFAALEKGEKTSRSSVKALPTPTPGHESDALDGPLLSPPVLPVFPCDLATP